MKSVVTAKVRIPFDGRIIRTMEVYSKAVQFCVDFAWEMGITDRYDLHEVCYRKIRNIFGLQSQLAVNAIKQAVEVVKKSDSKPIVKRYMTIRYNFPRCASVKNWETLSLSTIEGRIKLPITIPECYRQYLNWGVKESNLIYQKGKLFFCFGFAKEVAFGKRDNRLVLGIDLGVNNLAVTSDRRFYKGIKHLRIRHERIVASLQSKGTKAAKRKLKKLSGSWRQFQTWQNHNISKEIVSRLEIGDAVVMEDLKHIRRTAGYNKWVHKWAFKQLQSFIEYKAIRKGIEVAYAEPRNTSKTCCRCGSLETKRHTGFFECLACGYSLSADHNGAINIAGLYMRNTSSATVNRPILACNETKASFPRGIAV